MKKVTAFVAGLMLLVAMAAFAGTGQTSSKSTPKQHKAKTTETTRQASGTISSSDANQLVLSHKVNGKEEQTTFVMNDQTQKKGELRSGEKATVHYRVEGGQNIATMVSAKASKTASTSGMSKSHKKTS
jgi:uncharacterized protein YxeA